MAITTSSKQTSSNRQSTMGWASVHLWIAVVFFAIPAAGGILSFLELKRDGVGGVEGLDGALAVTVSPDGRNVYVAGNRDGSVAVFSRDATHETLRFVEAHLTGFGGVFGMTRASAVSASPDGRNVYVTGRGDDSVAIFSRDASADSLTFVDAVVNGLGGVFSMRGPSSATVSPDGRHLYVTGLVSRSLAIFTRDATTDALHFADVIEGGTFGVPGLGGASSVAVSGDGEQVYVTGQADNSLVVFSRDASVDDLVFRQVFKDGDEGVEGLGGARSVSPSPDGRHVYVAARDDDAVVVFEREPGTGKLEFVSRAREGLDRVMGLSGAGSVAVSPDGRLVLAAGTTGSGLAVFERDASTGELHFVEAIFDGTGGAAGLAGISGIAFSPDGRSLYGAGRGDDALTSFGVGVILFRDGFESGGVSHWTLSN